MWALALGSGTSGGVLAPLLMIDGALGGVESMFFPSEGVGFWPLISMGAILGGTMRVPFTAVMFVLELTHDFNAFLPLFIAFIVAYAFTVLVMKRSILTEKISRRGFHLSREYAIDPLEILSVREVMRTNVCNASPQNQYSGPFQHNIVVTAFPDEPLRLIVYRMAETGLTRMPVVARGGTGRVVGMISLADLLRARTRDLEEERRRERVLRIRIPSATH
jgi:chloride channel protein, CIC family